MIYSVQIDQINPNNWYFYTHKQGTTWKQNPHSESSPDACRKPRRTLFSYGKKTIFSQHWDIPVKINFTGIFICSAGTLDVEINLTPMRMDENHILVFTHEHAVRIVKRSEDFKCVGIILSKAYWEETLLHTHAFNALTRTVPCLPIEPDQKKPLLDFFSIHPHAYQIKGCRKPK